MLLELPLELPSSVKLKEGSIASRIFDVMKDQRFRTLQQIKDEAELNTSLQSISARLRDFRRENYGGFTLFVDPIFVWNDDRCVATRQFEYRLTY